jgi:hypothetical protein
MKRMASESASSRSSTVNGSSRGPGGFVLCIENSASLEFGKVYRTLRARKDVPAGWLRVIDESGEDYLYPADMFVPVQIPTKGRRALAK